MHVYNDYAYTVCFIFSMYVYDVFMIISHCYILVFVTLAGTCVCDGLDEQKSF